MLVRFSTDKASALRTGLLAGGRVHDIGARYPTIARFVAAHPDGWDAKTVDLAGTESHPAASVHLGPPVDDGASVYLVGANYKKHAEEAGLDVPVSPVIFMKPTTALVGPHDPIQLPLISSEMDYEGELAVMI